VTGAVPSLSTRRLLAERTQEYAGQMTAEAAAYLLGRGITKEAAEFFRIGFVASPLPGDDMYAGRLAIPYCTPSGVVAMKFRSLGGEKDNRFITFTGTTMKRLYNPGVLVKPHLTIYLCEGEIDTITAWMCGLPALGIPGVKQWRRTFSRALRNRRVVVLADGDDNGEGERFADTISGDVDDCGVILLTDEDVNSYFMKHGKDGLRERVGLSGRGS